MDKTTKGNDGNTSGEFVSFYIGDALCGISILRAQEIIKFPNLITQAPLAPEYVFGLLNLRGQLITVIDIGKKLGLSPVKPGKDSRNIIVNSQEEHIGLLVDSVGDFLQVEPGEIASAPSNLGSLQGKFFKGVYKTDNRLIGILDVDEILKYH